MTDIEALMKRCQIGVPCGPNAYDDLHSILAECYGTLGKLRDQLHLAEVVRAAQVEGLVQGVAGWRERANQLEAQVAALTAERDEARAAWGSRTQELERMEAERDGLREDALRYCWLNDNAVIETDTFRHDGKDPASTKQPLDAAIDAARAALGDSAPTTPPPSPSPRS